MMQAEHACNIHVLDAVEFCSCFQNVTTHSIADQPNFHSCCIEYFIQVLNKMAKKGHVRKASQLDAATDAFYVRDGHFHRCINDLRSDRNYGRNLAAHIDFFMILSAINIIWTQGR